MAQDKTYTIEVMLKDEHEMMHSNLPLAITLRSFQQMAISNAISFIRINGRTMQNPRSWGRHIEEVIHQTLPDPNAYLVSNRFKDDDGSSYWKEYLLDSLVSLPYNEACGPHAITIYEKLMMEGKLNYSYQWNEPFLQEINVSKENDEIEMDGLYEDEYKHELD